MSAFREGQWVRVRPEVPITGGQHGTVRVVDVTGAMVEFDDPITHMMIFSASELTTDVTITREAHARQQATLRVAHAEAALLDARKALREAAKAEIAAMPAIGSAKTFRDAVVSASAIMGVPTTLIDDASDTTFAEWHFSDAPPTWLIVAMWHDGLRVETCASGDRSEFRVVDGKVDGKVDAALKAALCWLADRDVFLPATQGGDV